MSKTKTSEIGRNLDPFTIMDLEKLLQEIEESIPKIGSKRNYGTCCTSWYTGSAPLAVNMIDWATNTINRLFDTYLPRYHARWEIWKIYDADISFVITIYADGEKFDYFLIEVLDKRALARLCESVESVNWFIRQDLLVSCSINIYRILYRPLMNQLISLYRSRHPIGFFKRSDALHVAVPTEDMTAYRREHRVELEEYRENVRVEQMTDQLAAEYKLDMENLRPLHQDEDNFCRIIRQNVIKIRPKIQEYSHTVSDLARRHLGMGYAYTFITPQVCGVENYEVYDDDTLWLCDPLSYKYCDEYSGEEPRRYITSEC